MADNSFYEFHGTDATNSVILMQHGAAYVVIKGATGGATIFTPYGVAYEVSESVIEVREIVDAAVERK